MDLTRVRWSKPFKVKSPGGGKNATITSTNNILESRAADKLNPAKPGIGWVIVGAESRGGGVGRPCNIEWVRKIVYQCKAAGVPVFVKQLHIDGKLIKNMEMFPEDLRLREVPFDAAHGGPEFGKVS